MTVYSDLVIALVSSAEITVPNNHYSYLLLIITTLNFIGHQHSMRSFEPIVLPLLAASATALRPPQITSTEITPLPLVIWHGLGDSYQGSGLKEIASLAQETNPDTYVHIINLADSDLGDREATFLGNVTEQLETVCAQLANEPILSTAPAVNALGFSQGGQFLRGYIERCNFPPVRNLVTVGSQHNGISEFQQCKWTDLLCNAAELILHAGRWSGVVQGGMVPAQYFRDPEELDEYLVNSNFLADVNNEREVKNVTYRENLVSLNRFAMLLFANDTVAHPKESAWFAEVNGTSGEVTHLRDRALYKEDWLGLRELDEKGALDFITVPGDHMQLEDDVMVKIFKEYFGPVEVDLPDVQRAKQGSVLVQQGA